MSTLSPASPVSDSEITTASPIAYSEPLGRRHFWLRRLHSLLGLLFGGYVVVHLLVNATGLWPRAYQQNVDKIHSLQPMLPLIEIATIFIPLLFHAIYGAYIASVGLKFNTTKYNYGGNVRYFLQRITAWVLLAFIAFHIATLHKWGFEAIYNMTHIDFFHRWGGMFNEHNQAFQSTVHGIRGFFNTENAMNPGNVLVMAFYLAGVWSACFHFANGLWTSAIAWGLTVTARSQKRWGDACLGFGVVVTLIGTMAWVAFTVAPAARGDVSRWDNYTRTTHEIQVDGQSIDVKGEPSNESTQP